MASLDQVISPLGSRRRVGAYVPSPNFLLNSSNPTLSSPVSPTRNQADFMSSPLSTTTPWTGDRTDGSASFWSDRWNMPEGRPVRSFMEEDLAPTKLAPGALEEDNIAFYPPKKWGHRNVDLSTYWSPRLTQALALLICIQCTLLAVFRSVAVALFVSSDTSFFWVVPYFLAIVISVLCLCSIHQRDYTAVPAQISTRFNAYLALFTPSAVAEWAKFAIGCSLVSWIFTAQLGLGLILSTADQKYLLNEESLFVVLSGAWVGTIIFLRHHFNFTRQRIRFPVIQRMKFLQLQTKARSTLKKSVQLSFWPVVSFTLSYHLIFGDIKHLIVPLSFFLNSSTMEIERCLYEMLNLRRFLVIYLCTILTIFSVKMSKIIVRIFLLAPHDFGIELFGRDQTELCLSEALNDSRLPLVRALAFRYLLSVSSGTNSHSKSCRRKIYTLSPMGDIPSEWRAIRDDCLDIIQKFSATLDDFQELVCSRAFPHDDVIPAVPSLLAFRLTRLRFHRERLMKQRKAMGIIDRVHFEFNQFLKRLRWLSYLFDEEKQNAFMFEVNNCQNVLSAVRSLACIIANSATEDQYGAVLQDVGEIVPILVSLKDKLFSLRKINSRCHNYCVYVQRSLVMIWLAFPGNFVERFF